MLVFAVNPTAILIGDEQSEISDGERGGGLDFQLLFYFFFHGGGGLIFLLPQS